MIKLEDCKAYIITRLELMDETDLIFIQQLCTLIKRYFDRKGGR